MLIILRDFGSFDKKLKSVRDSVITCASLYTVRLRVPSDRGMRRLLG